MLFAVAAVTGFSVYEQSNVSDLLNANVEALARDEIDPDCPNGCWADGGGCWCRWWYETYREAEH